MKEMMYSKNYKREVLDSGICCGYLYYIMSMGTHPCAYIKLPQSHPCYYKSYDEIPIEVHGGLTFKSEKLKTDNEIPVLGMYIGWDYGHIGDYSGMRYYNDENDKKWTTREILDDVVSVCEQLNELYYMEMKDDGKSNS